MKKTVILAAFLVAGLGWFAARSAQALTVDELVDLCRAGYSAEEILQFVETLGLDEPLDPEALVRLKEEGCTGELAVELMQTYGEEQEEEPVSGDESSSRVYVYSGWGYPSYWNWCGTGWYSPWWSIGYTWYDPWYWDSWYWPRYHYYRPYYDWAWWPYHHDRWWGDRDWHWGGSDYRYVTAHEKSYRTRPGLVARAKADAVPSGYRANVSRTAVEKSYKSRAGYTARVSAMEKSGVTRSSKSEYYTKGKSTTGSTVTSRRSVHKNPAGTSSGTYRKSGSGTATSKGTTRSRSSTGTMKRSSPPSRAPDRATGHSRSSGSSNSGAYRKSSSGTQRSAPPATSSGKSGSYTAPAPSSSGSTSSPPSNSGSPHPRKR